MKETNVFLAVARALWDGGEDGETIARDLALAFKAIAVEGKGTGSDKTEYARLSKEPKA